MQNYFKNKIFEVENNIFLLRAGNIGSLTFYGTNTYLIGKKSLRSLRKGDVFYKTDISDNNISPKHYNFTSTWGTQCFFFTPRRLSN